MQKFYILFLSILLLFSLSACGENLTTSLNGTPSQDNDNTSTLPDNGSGGGDNGTQETPDPDPTPTPDPNPEPEPEPTPDPTPEPPAVNPADVCLDPTQAPLNTGKKASGTVKLYPRVTVIGKEGNRYAYRASYTSESSYANTVTLEIASKSNLNGFPETIAEFKTSWQQPKGYVTIIGARESMQTPPLSANNLVVNYTPLSVFNFLLPVWITYNNVYDVDKYPSKESEISIPSYPNIDTTKEYYAKITYTISAEQYYTDQYCPENAICFKRNLVKKFECITLKE